MTLGCWLHVPWSKHGLFLHMNEHLPVDIPWLDVQTIRNHKKSEKISMMVELPCPIQCNLIMVYVGLYSIALFMWQKIREETRLQVLEVVVLNRSLEKCHSNRNNKQWELWLRHWLIEGEFGWFYHSLVSEGKSTGSHYFPSETWCYPL